MKHIVLLTLTLLSFSSIWAQENEPNQTEKRIQALENAVKTFKQLHISGYIQPQYQTGQKDATLKVGTANENPAESFSRIGIRRGRIKMVHTQGIASYLFQIDFTENGIGIRDLYVNLTDPWFKSSAFRAGVFYRPFGIEISYSSSVRESPERAIIIQTLFPGERDLGGMLVLQAPKSSAWNFLKLEAGLFAGNGIKQETDSKRDFIGHLSATKDIGGMLNVGAGISYYKGKVYQGTKRVYSMQGDGFVVDTATSNMGSFAKRQYMGADAFANMKTALGTTGLRGELIVGQQPGLVSSSMSPNSGVLPVKDTYLRNFVGGYVQLAHTPQGWPVSLVAKYEWYDPNTKLAGNAIGQSGTGKTDLAQTVFGLGTVWQLNKNLRLQAYYEFNRNETTTNQPGFSEDLKNDVLTMRFQYKF